MTKQKLLKASLIAIAVLSLTACQTLRDKSSTGTEVSDATSTDAAEATSTGVGSATTFTSDESNTDQNNASNSKIGNQTYYFDFDKSEIHDSDRPSVETQARYLAQHQGSKVKLEGHTDPRGSREYNIALGQRRANSVAEALKLQGANTNQLNTVSYGAEKALAGNSEQDYQLDRRVQLKYEGKN